MLAWVIRPWLSRIAIPLGACSNASMKLRSPALRPRLNRSTVAAGLVAKSVPRCGTPSESGVQIGRLRARRFSSHHLHGLVCHALSARPSRLRQPRINRQRVFVVHFLQYLIRKINAIEFPERVISTVVIEVVVVSLEYAPVIGIFFGLICILTEYNRVLILEKKSCAARGCRPMSYNTAPTST
jgi:hypothetical protein